MAHLLYPARKVPEPSRADPTSKQVRLDAIGAQVLTCRRCALHSTRTLGVPGVGPATARLMAIGEAPGEREDKEGKPFVGAAGRLLTELLEGVGLSRQDIFITNVIKSRPPGNRDPLPDEVMACAGYLDAQIAVIQPEVILLLGRHALQRLLPGAPGISQCHGQVMRSADRTYMPCYHPAAALYQGSLMPALRTDFEKLRVHLDSQSQAPSRAEGALNASGDSTQAEQLGLF